MSSPASACALANAQKKSRPRIADRLSSVTGLSLDQKHVHMLAAYFPVFKIGSDPHENRFIR